MKFRKFAEDYSLMIYKSINDDYITNINIMNIIISSLVLGSLKFLNSFYNKDSVIIIDDQYAKDNNTYACIISKSNIFLNPPSQMGHIIYYTPSDLDIGRSSYILNDDVFSFIKNDLTKHSFFDNSISNSDFPFILNDSIELPQVYFTNILNEYSKKSVNSVILEYDDFIWLEGISQNSSVYLTLDIYKT